MNFISLILLIGLGVAIYYLWKQTEKNYELDVQNNALREHGEGVLTFLHDVGEAFNETIKHEEIYRTIVQCAVRTSKAKSGAIFLMDDKNECLEAAVIEGAFPPPIPPDDMIEDKLVTRTAFLEQTIKKQKIKKGESVIGAVAESGKPLLIQKASEDKRLPYYEGEILQIHTFLAVPLIFREQKLGVLALANRKDDRPFNEEDLSFLSSIASQAAFAIFNARLHGIMTEKERMDRDLEIAREIQQILLPADPPKIEGLDVFALNVPALEVGGDYYDFIKIDDENYGFAIADVSGKGVSGALIMAMCRSALRSKGLGNPYPAQVLSQVNRVIHPDMREDMFIGMDYGVLNTKTHQFAFCRAGHEPLIVHRNNPRRIEILAPRGMALGIDSGTVFDSALQEQHMILEKGDILVFYTDGITEALDESGKEFDRDQLVEAIESCADQSAEQIAKNIEERVRRFIGNRAQNDDITLLVVRV